MLIDILMNSLPTFCSKIFRDIINWCWVKPFFKGFKGTFLSRFNKKLCKIYRQQSNIKPRPWAASILYSQMTCCSDVLATSFQCPSFSLRNTTLYSIFAVLSGCLYDQYSNFNGDNVLSPSRSKWYAFPEQNRLLAR